MDTALRCALGSRTGDTAAAVLRHGRHWIVAADPVEAVAGSGPDAFAALDRLTPGFWAGFVTFELGRAVEPVRAGRASQHAPGLPDIAFVRFARREVTTRSALLAALGSAAPAALGPARASSFTRDGFVAAAEVVLEHIRAGDCYQVNLTRTLTWDRESDPVALFGGLVAANPAPHAALLRVPTRDGPVAVVGASPERFLAWRGTRVETRPIKGTGSDAVRLARSAKDRAENVMIVDLARNDLGRVCVPGSIHVPALCRPEVHPGLVHLVSTVRGRRRAGVGIGTLLRATLPPASVTGAPKPRVLQIIEDLEPRPRGVYCGATGWIDTARDQGDLAVAIRTFTITSGRTSLGIGSGIVADSVPAAEWAETRLKARRLLAAVGATEPAPVAVLA